MGEAPLLGIQGNEASYLVPFSFDDVPNFTFRGQPNRLGTLNVCPASFRDASQGKIMDDISFKLLKDFKDFKTVLDFIPAVQIREYAFDSRLVQIQNAFKAFVQGWDSMNSGQQDNFLKSLGEYVKLIPGKIKDELKKLKNKVWSKAVDSGIVTSGDRKLFEFDIPFMLYYQICTAKNNGLYTIPYSGRLVDASNGSEGWNTQHGFGGMMTSKESVLGTIVNFIGKNVKFNTTPMWEGNTTHDFPQIEVQFELFNDTLDAAINNFLFLTSIMSKNRFIQYHIFQQNPCVYDIKIEGYNRLYMCSGNMQCEYKGVSRRPPDKFYKEMKKYKGDMFKNITDKKMMDNRMISIPDIYSFKLTFQSLLPNSMNNYLFRFSGNPNVETMDAPLNVTKDLGDTFENAHKSAAGEAGLS